MSKSGPTIKRGKSKQNIATPWHFIQAVEKKVGEKFAFDLAAERHTAKAPKFFTKEDDAFNHVWSIIPGLIWLNPEFNNISQWALRCWYASMEQARIIMLVPASVGSNWFRDYVYRKCRVIFLNGRITFLGHTIQFPKDLMLCCYGFPKGFEIWKWC